VFLRQRQPKPAKAHLFFKQALFLRINGIRDYLRL
jgi:hypothetical protein